MNKLTGNLIKNIIATWGIVGALMLGLMSSAFAVDKKGNVLVVVSSLSEISLQDGKTYPTGYFLNELAIPVKALIDAGYEP
ncbi:MAG: type 1 glutamine amidotransferase domain-containing protein, partial [Moraxellaceae bacterium]